MSVTCRDGFGPVRRLRLRMAHGFLQVHPPDSQSIELSIGCYPQLGASRELAARVLELPPAAFKRAEPPGQSSEHLTHGGGAEFSKKALVTTPAGFVERLFAPWDRHQNRQTQTRSPKPSPDACHDPHGTRHPHGRDQRGAGHHPDGNDHMGGWHHPHPIMIMWVADCHLRAASFMPGIIFIPANIQSANAQQRPRAAHLAQGAAVTPLRGAAARRSRARSSFGSTASELRSVQ